MSRPNRRNPAGKPKLSAVRLDWRQNELFGTQVRRADRVPTGQLLQLDLRAGLLKGGLHLLGLFLVHAFLHRLRRAFDEVLGFLQAEAGQSADFLDDLDLLVASGSQNDRELGLLFRRGGSSAGRTGGNSNSSGGRDAPLLFQHLGEVSGLEDGERREIVDDFLQVSHGFSILFEPDC
jgi:hypothetical protein